MTERQAAPRYAIAVPALCWRRDGSEFHAVTVDLSAGGLRLRSAVLPRAEETLGCNIRGVGATEAEVVRVGACDFTLRFTGRDPSPGVVARRLLDLARQQAGAPETVRVDRRIVPVQTAVRISLADGTALPATILNLSASGVGLRLDAALAVGQEIVVGRRRATVARRIEGGVGAAFLEPLEAVGEHTVL